VASAARIFGDVPRDDDALTLQIPTDGGVRSLRALLDQLEQEHIEVDALTVHTPDLDDVYFALTGHAVTEKELAS
jgi:ABC-2 type transport system ATP-binding protein